jgi:hypothetical protein
MEVLYLRIREDTTCLEHFWEGSLATQLNLITDLIGPATTSSLPYVHFWLTCANDGGTTNKFLLVILTTFDNL